MSKQSQTLYKITVTAVFLALGVVVSLLASFDIPVLGESGIKVGFAGVFTSFPALLFGPWYGGAASALADFFRAIIKPTGAFNPLFTLTAFLGGFLRGLIFSCLRNKKALAVKIGTYAVGLVSIAAGIINRFLLHADGISPALFDGMEPAAVDVGKFSLIGRLIVSRAAITKTPPPISAATSSTAPQHSSFSERCCWLPPSSTTLSRCAAPTARSAIPASR